MKKSHLIGRKLAALAVLGAAVVASNAQAADDMKQLRFGVEASYAPFESKSPSG